MTNSPPPDPRSSQTTALGFDELLHFAASYNHRCNCFGHFPQESRLPAPSILSASPSPTDLTVTGSLRQQRVLVPPCKAAFSSSRPDRVTGCVDTGAESHPNSRTGSRDSLSTTPKPTPRSAPPTSTPGELINCGCSSDYWARPY